MLLFWRRNSRLSVGRTPRLTRRSFRPQLEMLEDRLTPSTIPAVTIFTDSNTPGAGSLRDAIIATNLDTVTGGTDVIQLSAGKYTLSLQNTSGPTDATLGDLNLTNTVRTIVIQGTGDTGTNPTVIDASLLNDRVFQIVPGATVQFQNLVIQGGDAQDDGTTPSSLNRGGGILNNGGYVTLTNVVVQNNQATGRADGDANGGGIYSLHGALTLTNAVVQNNTASAGTGFDSPAGIGGGIADLGSLATITHSLIEGNKAIGGTGADGTGSTYTQGRPGGPGAGGGLYVSNGSVQILATTISGNTAQGGDGGIGFSGYAGGTGGNADGGGLFLGAGEVTVRDSTTSGNFVVGGNGGNGGTNTGNGDGGNGGTGGGADGGGFHVAQGTLILINTTVADNNPYSGDGGNGGNGGNGGGPTKGGDGGNGGVAWGGGIGNAQTLDTFNVTIAGNFVWAGGGGVPGIGGIGGGDAGLYGLIGSTQGGGIWNDGAHTVNLTNTIIATNVATTGPDFVGTVSTSDHALIGDNKDASGFSPTLNGDIVGTPDAPINPLLGPLQNNGGPTKTMALLPGSPAINHGDTSAVSATGRYDQRAGGFSRVVNSIIDIGAVEFGLAAVTINAGNVVTNFSGHGQVVTLTATLTGPVIVTEGAVTFTILDSKGKMVGSSVQANVIKGYASISFHVPPGQAAGAYMIEVSYSDPGGQFVDGLDNKGTLTIKPAPKPAPKSGSHWI